ncbi:MAG TPA: hypothetical protein VFH68_14975 [Polyangia bacterium]|jgi:hypothetical protein|nr:hypothetical protein [Polyangia bacterium]
MTLKLTMIVAVLASGLIGATSQAKADVVRVNVRPAVVGYAAPAARPGAWQQQRHYRPGVVPGAPNQGYGFLAARTQAPSVVALEIRAQMERAAEDLRFDVRRGLVERRALASLAADRQEIERGLAVASARGYITMRDRLHLEQHVQEIRDLRTQFRCTRPAQVNYRR